ARREHEHLRARERRVRAHGAADLEAAAPREHEVEEHEVRPVVGERAQRLLAVPGEARVVPRGAHDELERGEDRLLVLGDEHAARAHAASVLAAAAAATAIAGSANEKTDPRPGSLCTQSRPPKWPMI